jgi:hypothetical protein
MDAKTLKTQTGLSLPVCKVIARWTRSDMGTLWAAHEREGRVPKLLRRARKAIVIEELFPMGETGIYTLYAVGPKGRYEIGNGWGL